MNRLNEIKRTLAFVALIGTPFIANESYGLNARYMETQYRTISEEPYSPSLESAFWTVMGLSAFAWRGIKAINQSYTQDSEEKSFEEKLKLEKH